MENWNCTSPNRKIYGLSKMTSDPETMYITQAGMLIMRDTIGTPAALTIRTRLLPIGTTNG